MNNKSPSILPFVILLPFLYLVAASVVVVVAVLGGAVKLIDFLINRESQKKLDLYYKDLKVLLEI